MSISNPIARGIVSGVAGAVAWFAGMLFFFGPAQIILTDPRLQSAKFLAVFTANPAPRMNAAPWMLAAGLLVINVLWSCVYVWLSANWAGPWWKRGLKFGVVSWTLMVPWFEFYLPWNVMREPTALVALEMVCWAAVLLLVGLTIGGVEAALRRR